MASRAPSTARLARVAFIGLAILAGAASAASFSGRVVTASGEAVEGFLVHVLRAELDRSGRCYQAAGDAGKSTSGVDGTYEITGLPGGPLTLTDIFHGGHRLRNYRLVSARFGAVTLYGRHAITFSMDSTAELDDVEIAVAPLGKIRGRVLYPDGSPVANTSVQIEHRTDHGTGGASSTGAVRTDANGGYELLAEEAGVHTVSVEHQGWAARRSEIITTLSDPQATGVDLVLTDAPLPPIDRDTEEWVENPANGHQYRTVDAGGWFECRRAAIELGARLVTITDAEEEEWLLDMFGGRDPYWIGLVDEQGDGAWTWMSAESTEYSNWWKGWPLPAEGRRRYAHMNWIDTPETRGLWRDVGPDGSDWLMVNKAIIERDPTPAK